MFVKVNNYLLKLVNSIIKIELEKNSSDWQDVTTNATSKQIRLVLPYTGKPGNNIIWKMNRQLHKHLKDDVKVKITNQGTKLSSRFHTKNQTKFEYKNDVVYCWKCPENGCMISILDILIGKYQRELLLTIREINIHILCNIHKIRNLHMFG